MTMQKRILAAVLAAAVLAGGSAYAAEGPAPADADASGEITAAEDERVTEADAMPAAEAAPSEESDEIDGPNPAADGAAADEETEPGQTAARPWVEPGSTDAAIREGGWYLLAGDTVYYSDGGLWAESDAGTRCLSPEDARNLNRSGDRLYFTVGDAVRRMDRSGGTSETVFTAESAIVQLYVMGPELRFLTEKGAFSYDMDTDTLTELAAPEHAGDLIPTPAGNVFLTGSGQDRTLWAGTERVCGGVQQAWRDGDWLVLVRDGETEMVRVEDLFSGAFSVTGYDLHEEMLHLSVLSEEEQLASEAAYYRSEEYAAFMAGLSMHYDGAYTASNGRIASTAAGAALSADERNLLLRSQQMLELTWTPRSDVLAYGGDDAAYQESIRSWSSKIVALDGTRTDTRFVGGKTYQGVPYAQPYRYTDAGSVGWDLTIRQFLWEVGDPNSRLYSDRSDYNHTGPYYGNDCAAFVSWAWGSPDRRSLSRLVEFDAAYIGKDIAMLRLGDCVEAPDVHVALVTDIAYDAAGKVVSVEITEQTPCIMRRICYGELIPGKTYQLTGTLSYFLLNYLGGGYGIYRRTLDTPVPAPEDLSVPIGDVDGDGSADGLDAARLLRYAVGSGGDLPTETADTDRNGRLDAADAAAILRRSGGA